MSNYIKIFSIIFTIIGYVLCYQFNYAMEDEASTSDQRPSISPSILYKQGIYFRDHPDQDEGYTKAIECLSEVISLQENNVLAMHNLGILYWRLKDPQHAIVWFNRASKLKFGPSTFHLTRLQELYPDLAKTQGLYSPIIPYPEFRRLQNKKKNRLLGFLFLELPEDIRLHIFNFLDIIELTKTSLVSKEWQRSIYLQFQNVNLDSDKTAYEKQKWVIFSLRELIKEARKKDIDKEEITRKFLNIQEESTIVDNFMEEFLNHKASARIKEKEEAYDIAYRMYDEIDDHPESELRKYFAKMRLYGRGYPEGFDKVYDSALSDYRYASIALQDEKNRIERYRIGFKRLVERKKELIISLNLLL